MCGETENKLGHSKIAEWKYCVSPRETAFLKPPLTRSVQVSYSGLLLPENKVSTLNSEFL